jgi:hypothetical protein
MAMLDRESDDHGLRSRGEVVSTGEIKAAYFFKGFDNGEQKSTTSLDSTE